MTSPRGAAGRAVRVGAGLLGSTALYYALRAAGLDVAPALLLGALVSAAPAVVALARGERPRGLAASSTVLVVAGVLVALVPGDTRFLLAREAVLSGGVGVWFLASTRAARPLAYRFSRPLAEGRLRWPSDWERLWVGSPAFRRMWRTSSVLWGVGTLLDAAGRVAMAYALPPDQVPALSLALFLGTAVLLNVVTTVYYARCGAFDPHGPFHAPLRTPV